MLHRFCFVSVLLRAGRLGKWRRRYNGAMIASSITPSRHNADLPVAVDIPEGHGPDGGVALYRARRERVLAMMRERGGGVAIVPTAHEALRNRSMEYPYRHDSYFYYLTGFTEPQALLVLDANARGNAPSSMLFCREKNAERETWEGFRFGPDAAREAFGFDAAHAISRLDKRMPALLARRGALYYALGVSPTLDAQVRGWLHAVRAQGRNGSPAPGAAFDLLPLLDDMRLIKDEHELALMRRAAKISALAHRRAMAACRPGMHEYELEAELLYTFRKHGAQAPAYNSIVAAGANACVLHYPAGNAVMRDGDLVLIDAACELNGYAADITRTFPANGRFSGPQRELYDIVLASQQAAIDAMRAGVAYDAPHQATVRVLAQGLLDTGIISRSKFSSVDDVIAEQAYKRFYMHQTGHWLGMDVHDCGAYRAGNRQWRALQPGMTLTIEPGLYIRAADDVPQRYWNTGIRIEDNAIITSSGCELITRDVPVNADEIEKLMIDT